MNNVLRTGIALAATVAGGYAACTPALFDFGSFLSAALVMTAWAFGLGLLFGSIFTRLGDTRGRTS